MTGAKVYNLPTGEELMSGPIVSGGETRREKEIMFLMQNVDNRLTTLDIDLMFETYKWVLFVIGILSGLVGVTLILFGLHATYIFEKYQEFNIPALVFGSCFCIPLLIWFGYVFIPGKAERKKRKAIHKARRDRRKPTLFNEMVADAKRKAAPPPRKIKVLAHVRKHDYPIICTTWKEFCELLENAVGLPIERQLIRFKDEDLHIDLTMNLDEPPYNLDNGDRLHIYNKGGFFTVDAPIKKQLKEINTLNAQTQKMIQQAQADRDAPDKTRLSMLRETFRKKDSFEEQKQTSDVYKGRNNSYEERKKSSFSDGANKKKSFSKVSFQHEEV